MALCHAAEEAASRQPAACAALATQALEAAQALNYPEAQALAYIARAEAHYRLAQYDVSIADAAQALHLYTQLNDLRGQTNAQDILGMTNYIQGHFAVAMHYMDQCVTGRRTLGLSLQLAGALNNRAIIYRRLGDTPKALAHYLDSLQIARTQGHHILQATSQINIGQIHASLGDHEDALAAFHEAHQLLDQAHAVAMRNNALLNIGLALLQLGRNDQALQTLQRCRDAQYPNGDPFYAASALQCIGQVYLKQGLMAQAQEALRTCVAERRAINNLTELPACLLLLAQALMGSGQHTDALQALNDAQATAQQLTDRPGLGPILALKAKVLAQMGCYAEAYVTQKEASQIHQEALNAQSLETMRNFQVLHQLDRARHQAETLRMEAQQLTAAVEYKSRELTLLTLNLIQRNNMLRDLRQAVRHAERSHRNRQATAPLQQLARKLDHTPMDSKAHETFEDQFLQLNQHLLSRLVQVAPALSNAELKVCALIHNGLSNKEMANLTGTTVRNVESHRYRIRKKLDLGRTETLHQFLLTL